MQNAEDRRRLSMQGADGEIRPLATVLKCAAGIATLFVVAAGPWVVLTADTNSTAAEYAARAAAAFPSSIEQSRRVYEERRERARSREDGTKAALAK